MKKFIVFLALGCVLTVSCKEENGIWGRRGNSASIRVNVSGINGPATKAGVAGEQLFDSFVIDTIGGRELKLEAYVSDYNPDCPDEETKGAITTTGSITKFWMNAYAHDTWYDNEIPYGTSGSRTNPKPAGEYFSQKVVSRTSTSSSDWSIADEPKWLNDVSMTFWSWAGEAESSSNPNNPAPGLTPTDIDMSNNKASISYTTNGGLDLVYAFNKENRKFDDKTGEITGGSGTYNSGYKDAMDIKFYHALSAIRFDISGLKADDLTIKKVTFKGVVNQATCVITNGRNKADTADSLKFAWTPKTVTDPETNKANLSMEFNASEDFTATGVDGTTADALMPMSSSKFLFFIPQKVEDSGIEVELVYEDASGTEHTKTASLDHATAWDAGKYYTYRLSVKKGLSVTVDDDLTDNVKNNLSIKYEGDKSAYIRALIVAYWVDASGNFLSNCDYKTQGTLVGLASSPWEENTTDGFFYYNAEVVSGTDVGPSLLTSYTAPAPPIDGAILRMVIAAQATKYDSSKTCYQAFNSNNTTK